MPSAHTKRQLLLLTEQDKKELIAAIAKECGYVIPDDDPIFALVFIQNCVLGRTIDVLAERVEEHLVSQLERVHQRHVDEVGSKIGKRLYEELQSLSEVFREVEERVDARGRRWLWAMVSTGSVLIILFGLTVLGFSV